MCGERFHLVTTNEMKENVIWMSLKGLVQKIFQENWQKFCFFKHKVNEIKPSPILKVQVRGGTKNFRHLLYDLVLK